MERLGIDRSLLDRAKGFFGLEESKMKLTKEQLKQIIKEELEAVLSEDEIEEGQPVRRAPKMITMDQYRKMSPEEQKMINPEDVLGYVGPDGEDAYGNKPPPSRR